MRIEDIEIERYTPEVVLFYKSNGALIDLLYNEHEFNKLRNKLVENELTDQCYFMWKDIKITIDKEGNMSSFPRNLYDIVQQDMAKLFRIKRKKENKNEI
jgi:predicted ATPase